MQSTSQTWRDLFAAGAALQARATIGGTVYTDISAPVINRALMQDRLGVGNVVSASLALAVRGAVNIPRSAAVAVEVRLNDGQTASEWLPQGTFYISRRMRDPVTGLLALECYDALLKANAVWVPSAGAWPRTLAAVTAELAALLGVTLDGRTVIPSGAAYAMSEPAEGTTIRDALGVVAQAAGGNWIMTPENRLRLVRLGESGGTADVIGVTGGIDVGQAGTVTGVRSTVDGVVTLIGDDTGIVVDVAVAPVIAAEMAEDLIGQAYAPFRLTGAIYDPAAELGDGVRAGAGGEVVSALCSEQAVYGPAFRGDIAAPDPGELTDEYPYIGSADKTLALAKAAVTEAVDALDDELTQQEIFNRLTDNGAAQGIILYNGQLYINATYINAGFLNVGRVNFNEPDSYYDVPNENDPDSLLSGQTVVDGWIVNTSGTGKITVFFCGFAIPLRGKTITVTFTYNGSLSGGTDSWTSISNTAQQFTNEQNWITPSGQTIPNPYTRTVTVPDDAMFFQIAVACSGVKLIEVSLSSPVTPSDSIEYNYEGQQIGDATKFRVYRDGTLITYAKSIFNGVTRMSRLYLDVPLDVNAGGTGATTAANARTKLGITPENIAFIGMNPTGGTSNDTREWWANKGTCYTFIAGANQVNGQPADYGFIVNIVYADEVYQMWLSAPGGARYHRGGNYSTSVMPGWTADDTNIITSVNGQTGAVSITPANIGAAPIPTGNNLPVTGANDLNDSPPGWSISHEVTDATARANAHMPFQAWCYINTIESGSSGSAWKTQMAFPWYNTDGAPAIRQMYDNGTWTKWTYYGQVSTTVTATTDANSNISLGISASSYVVVSVKVPSLIATPWVSGGDNSWHARITGVNGGAYASQSVTATVYYRVV